MEVQLSRPRHGNPLETTQELRELASAILQDDIQTLARTTFRQAPSEANASSVGLALDRSLAQGTGAGQLEELFVKITGGD